MPKKLYRVDITATLIVEADSERDCEFEVGSEPHTVIDEIIQENGMAIIEIEKEDQIPEDWKLGYAIGSDGETGVLTRFKELSE